MNGPFLKKRSSLDDLARWGIVTPGMLRRQKAILAELPKEEEGEESAPDLK